jgi:YggT family protein
MSGLIAVGYFLISLLFDVILFTLWTRVALRYLRISSLNPFSRLIYTLTNPIIGPLYSLFRYKDIAKQRYDWPVLIIIFLVEILKVVILCYVVFQALFPFVYILLYALADFIIQPCNLLFFAILIRVIMSYINPFWNHPIADFLRALTEPLLILGRKIIPDISGFDFSPFIMMIILKVITLFINASLPLRLL